MLRLAAAVAAVAAADESASGFGVNELALGSCDKRDLVGTYEEVDIPPVEGELFAAPRVDGL